MSAKPISPTSVDCTSAEAFGSLFAGRTDAYGMHRFPHASKDVVLTPFLPGEERGQRTKLGEMLRKKLGKVVVLSHCSVGGSTMIVRIAKTRVKQRGAMYALEVVAPGA